MALLGGGSQVNTNSPTGAGEAGGTNPGTVATPTFSPSAGNQTSLSNISLSTTTSEATIYYTTDGSNPSASSSQYTGALVNTWSLAGKTIKAIATKTGMTGSGVLSGIFSYPPLKTGQTVVYSVGDNGTNQTGISRSYTDNGDGTVTDNATGLIWQKCSVGKTGSDCSGGSASTMNWDTAISTCSGLSFAGKTWRLPSMQELETLPDYGKSSSPVIDTAYFPNTAAKTGIGVLLRLRLIQAMRGTSTTVLALRAPTLRLIAILSVVFLDPDLVIYMITMIRVFIEIGVWPSVGVEDF
ncbi:MAG: DUF1566 domain-containing protein [Leptospiraceae bacterium]|nr:DUF1566 domain-containing protein [Leptospiraceae bacterium]